MGSTVSPAISMRVDRLRYPAMQLREIQVWKAWLYQYSTRFDSYYYNVRLGEGVDPGPSFPDGERRGWIANSMKRVDVIAVKGGHVTIIEVEENPGLGSFGQLEGYRTLWRNRVQAGGPPAVHIQLGVENFFPKDLPPDPDPSLLLVSARASTDAMAVARASGVELIVVPTDFSVLRKVS